jgi:hypothetical protein
MRALHVPQREQALELMIAWARMHAPEALGSR